PDATFQRHGGRDLVFQRCGEALVEQVVPTQRAAWRERGGPFGLQLGVLDGLVERPSQRLFGEFLAGGVADASRRHDPKSDAAAGGEANVGEFAALRLDRQGAVAGRQHFEIDAAVLRLVEQPRLRFTNVHASPPTTISLTSRCGCPTSVGIEPDIEPHMPGSVLRSSDTATMRRIDSGPLPTSIAPRTGSAISPLRIMNPSRTAKLYSPDPGRTWPPPMVLA